MSKKLALIACSKSKKDEGDFASARIIFIDESEDDEEEDVYS